MLLRLWEESPFSRYNTSGMAELNQRDKDIWERIFRDFPAETWKGVPPSAAMEDCLQFFLEAGVRTVLDVGCGPGRWSVYLR
ncbi:MAG TPA: class I SAM-dependent methyltransferase [Aridibacter sp.]|nr:class I SAM-dependent methyltransferase [Aridibacter sp.]